MDPVPPERERGLFSSPGSALTYSIDFTLIALFRSRLVAQRWSFRSWAQVTVILGWNRAVYAGGSQHRASAVLGLHAPMYGVASWRPSGCCRVRAVHGCRHPA